MVGIEVHLPSLWIGFIAGTIISLIMYYILGDK